MVSTKFRDLRQKALDFGKKSRHPRYLSPQNIFVGARSLGSDLCFTLEARTFSKSGFLLSAQGTVSLPFRENSILSLVIDQDGEHFAKPIKCLARVVGFRGPDALHLGLAIVQMDSEDMINWDCELLKLSNPSLLSA